MVCTPMELNSVTGTLRCLGFTPACADLELWMRDGGKHCKCVVMCVDDTFMALLNPDKFCKKLQSAPWNCDLKDVEEPACCLSGNFFCNKDGTFCCGALTCMKHSCGNFKIMFGAPPAKARAPVDKDDKPNFDNSAELRSDGVQKFQFVVGATQWLIALC